MCDEKVLTKEIAEQFFLRGFTVVLTNFTAIEDEAAKILSKSELELALDSLATLSDEAAKSLSNHQGSLYLDGLTEVSDATAESFGEYRGHFGDDLSLDGLTTLSDAAAESLSKGNNRLFLDGLANLSDTAAESLGGYTNDLSLNGLTSLSDAAAATLSNHQGELALNGLTELSDAAAESFSKHDGSLKLMGLQELSEAAAESLSKGISELAMSIEPPVHQPVVISKGSGSNTIFVIVIAIYFCCFAYFSNLIGERFVAENLVCALLMGVIFVRRNKNQGLNSNPSLTAFGSLTRSQRSDKGPFTRWNVVIIAISFVMFFHNLPNSDELNKLRTLRPMKRGRAHVEAAEFEEALVYFDKALKRWPQGHPDGEAAIYFNRGTVYLKLEKYDKALLDYDIAIRLAPTRGQLYFVRGIVHSELGNDELANADFSAATTLGFEVPSQSPWEEE